MQQGSILWGVGQTTPALTLVCQNAAYRAIDLTGASLLLLLQPTSGGSDVNGVGTFTLISATQGIVEYLFAAQDVATAGTYTLYIIATFATGPYPSEGIRFTLVGR